MVNKDIEDMDIDEAEVSPASADTEEKSATESETYYDAEPEEDRSHAEPPVKAGKYRAFSIIFFLLTAGGLFLGLLGKFIPWLSPTYYSGNAGLNDSLLGFFLTRMKDIASASFTALDAIAVVAALVLLATVLISVITLFISLFSARRARRAAALSGTVSLLSYTLAFLWAICVNSLTMPAFSAEAVDVPVALITLLLFVFMTVFAIIENGKAGLFSAGIYLFSVISCFAIFFPGSFTESHFILLKTFTQNPIYNSFVLAALAVILATLVISVIAFLHKRRGILFIVLSSLQLAVVLLLCIAGCGLGKNWSLQFFQNGSLIPSLVLIFASLGAVLFAGLTLAVQQKQRQLAAEEDEDEDYTEAEFYDTDDKDDTYDADDEETETVPHEYATEAEEDVTDEDYRYSDGEGGEEPAEPEPFHEEEMSAFEREMFSLAEKGAEETPAEEESIPPAPQYAPPPPAFRPVNVYTDPTMQYVYDPFINELTPEEKDEFGDLFIACKSGKFGDLPVYHIGGDNREFFDKVWIRYGLYDMSPNLRDKIFNYLRRYRSKQQ